MGSLNHQGQRSKLKEHQYSFFSSNFLSCQPFPEIAFAVPSTNEYKRIWMRLFFVFRPRLLYWIQKKGAETIKI
jgi:hypothetical protein